MKIDRILTGKYTAIPCFVGIMGLVFFLTFSVIGAFLQNLLDMGITALARYGGPLDDGSECERCHSFSCDRWYV